MNYLILKYKRGIEMKKIISFIICLIIAFSFVIPASAAEVASVKVTASSENVKVGDNVTFTVSLSGTASATSALADFSFSDKFTAVSAEWITAGNPAVKDFDVNGKAGVIAYEAANNFNGNYCKIVLKAKESATTAQALNVSVTLKSGDSNVFTGNGSKGVKIVCATHTFGDWGVVDKVTCVKNGSEKRTCSICGTVETRVVNATGHKFENPTITKEATCTEDGEESGVCLNCGEPSTNVIKAKGHKFGEWTQTTAATCTDKGLEERTCSVCSYVEEREIKALGHTFSDPKVVKEATIASTGLIVGVCDRCDKATRQIIPCSVTDEKTGIYFETNEGVFELGTKMKVEEIVSDSEDYESIKNAVSDITEKFAAYNISAELSGEAVQPKGTLNISFKIPEGFSKNLAIYCITAEGNKQLVESTVSRDGKTVTVKLSSLGNDYVICDLAKEEAEEPTDNTDKSDTDKKPVKGDNDKKDGNNILWIIIAVIIAIIVIGGIILAILLKKKSNK